VEMPLHHYQDRPRGGYRQHLCFATSSDARIPIIHEFIPFCILKPEVDPCSAYP
jgi:hypothetical protein